ncbi:MAG TPA: DUF6064 family protein [Gemmatimonadaceae bacterium]|jgi:hypothetical protein|nr:DUF6064 family protein [Gemmatimonadaceae bacterium]
MSLPFTIDQFLDVFRRYNEAIWPGQLLLNLLAVVAVVAAVRGGRGASRIAAGILAAVWLWTGVVYHVAFFRAINPAALLFGLVFVIEGLLIAWFGVARHSLRFEVRANVATFLAFALVVYALVAYPMIGYALGHRYPSAPTFGVPCPTTIFTFGLLLLCPPPRLRSLIIIPAAWAVLGVSAATRLGMWEDYGLVLAAIVATIAVLVQRSGRREVPATHRVVTAT